MVSRAYVKIICELEVQYLNTIAYNDEGGLCLDDRPDFIHFHRGLQWQRSPRRPAPGNSILNCGGEPHTQMIDISTVLVPHHQPDTLTTANC